MQTEQVGLKFQKIEAACLLKGDIVLHGGQLWQCASKHMKLFINLDTRIQQYIKTTELLRINKLQLLAKEWSVKEGKVQLKGQELGLGPIHDVMVTELRDFKEMEVIKMELEKGRRLEYKVVLCEMMASRMYLLVAIQFL